MRVLRIKHGQSVLQKTVRNMSTKDNPGTLPVNLYLTEQSTSRPLISVQLDSQTRDRQLEKRIQSIMCTPGKVFFILLQMRHPAA